MARTSNAMLNGSGKSGHLCFIYGFSRKALVFHCWVLCWLWVCGKCFWLCWDMFLLYSFWWEALSWMDVEFCQILFLCLLKWSCGFCFSFFLNVMLPIDLCLFNLAASWEELTQWKRLWCWEGLGAGGEGLTDSMDMSLSELRELVMDREAWRAVIRGVAKSRTRLSDWTD